MSSSEVDEALAPVKKLLGEKDVAIQGYHRGQGDLKIDLIKMTNDRESWRKACVQWEKDYYKLSEKAKAAEVDRDRWKKLYEGYAEGGLDDTAAERDYWKSVAERRHLDADDWSKLRQECAKGSIPRIITEDELEVGQIIASVRPGAHVPVVGGLVTKTYGASDGFLEVELDGNKKIIGLAGGSIHLLKEAHKPELPTEPGSVVLVEGISDDCNQDMRVDLPFFAAGYGFGGKHYWDSLDGKWNMPPEFITKWRPAKVTAE